MPLLTFPIRTPSGAPLFPIITTPSLPGATVGVAYSFQLSVSSGAPPYTWSIASASPNSGSWLSVSGSGLLTGTPGTAELELLTIRVIDSAGRAGVSPFQLPVAAGSVGPVTGFTPNAGLGVTASGVSFANGQAITINLPAGGLVARVNPLPLFYYPMGEDGSNNLSTHPLLSRTQRVLIGSELSNTILQSGVAPPNALAAVKWIPVCAGANGGGAMAFGSSVASGAYGAAYATFPGGAGAQIYSLWKTYQGFAANNSANYGGSALPDNCKMWRLWPSIGVGHTPDCYLGHKGAPPPVSASVASLVVENNDNATNLPPANPGGHFTRIADKVNQWRTYEVWHQENTFNVSDGIFNAADNALRAYPLTTTYGQCNANNAGGQSPDGKGPLRFLYLDEYTNNHVTGGPLPNGTTDYHVYGLQYYDDSWLQVIVTDEGATYSTDWAARTPTPPPVDFKREIQIQTNRADNTVSLVLRQGSHSKGPSYNVLAVTGLGTAINLGTGIWQ